MFTIPLMSSNLALDRRVVVSQVRKKVRDVQEFDWRGM